MRHAPAYITYLAVQLLVRNSAAQPRRKHVPEIMQIWLDHVPGIIHYVYVHVIYYPWLDGNPLNLACLQKVVRIRL